MVRDKIPYGSCVVLHNTVVAAAGKCGSEAEYV